MEEQIVLDPRDETTHGNWKPLGPLPRHIRAFGRYPNVESWQPGDLILVSSIKPDVVTSLIRDTQLAGGYSPEDACWSHAAMYIGTDIGICEATRKGVAVGPIYPYLGRYRIRVRRGLLVSREDGWNIAANALVRLRDPYSFASIAALAVVAKTIGYWNPRTRALLATKTRAVICSRLYAEAFSMRMGTMLENSLNGEITPAFLSFTPALKDMPAHWNRIG